VVHLRVSPFICKTSDLIWRLQKLVSISSVIGRLFSTPLRHSAMILRFPIPAIRQVTLSTHFSRWCYF
jgi:hypothetical protein